MAISAGSCLRSPSCLNRLVIPPARTSIYLGGRTVKGASKPTPNEGRFKGSLVGSKPYTQMAIYTNPPLHPGWQQAPDLPRGPTHVRIEYYFDCARTTPDRVEVVTVGGFGGNSFVMQEHKLQISGSVVTIRFVRK